MVGKGEQLLPGRVIIALAVGCFIVVYRVGIGNGGNGVFDQIVPADGGNQDSRQADRGDNPRALDVYKRQNT